MQEKIPKISVKFPDIVGPIPDKSEAKELKRWMADLERNGIVVDAHIRLFLHEFIEHATNNDIDRLSAQFASDKAEFFKRIKDRAKQRAQSIFHLPEDMAVRESEKQFKRDLFVYISYRPDPDALVQLLAIISRCKNEDPIAYNELHLSSLPNLEFYAKLNAGPDKIKLDRMRQVLEPKHIIEWFTKQVHATEFDGLLKRVAEFYDPKDPQKREIEEAACLFIRGLVHCTDGPESDTQNTRERGDWYYHFLEALHSHGDCRMFTRAIDPNWREDLDRWRARKEIGTGPVDGDLLEDLVPDDEEEEFKPMRDQKDFLSSRNTLCLEFEPEAYQLRPYQNELVLHAKNGRNAIICAPTGSGKTLVAVEIIKDHLEKRHREGKVGRCVMLVPTVPLVDQQSLHFVQYLAQFRDLYSEVPYWVDGFSGVENVQEGRAGRVLASEICVMTPQILINMMNSVLRKERVNFADFSLLIFDECHHCDKGHPYKILLEMLGKEAKKLSERPQIVGLTASMGVGDSGAGWDMTACRTHMLKLCSNLTADTISTVRHQLDNLKCYVMPPVDSVVRVKRPINNQFVEEIHRVMVKIESDMNTELKKHMEQLKLKQEDINFPSHDSHARYQTMVGTLKKQVNRVMDSDKRFFLVRSIDHLAHYFHAIVISDLLPNKFAFAYLEDKMANYGDGNGKRPENSEIDRINRQLMDAYSDLRKLLQDLAQNERVQEKEILNKLHEILVEQFEKEPDSRCMIFVATRNSAQKLAAHLNEVQELPIFYKKNNVGFMVSSNQSGVAGGQSSQEQQRMRNDFNSGRIKVLVVTSVAEEGLDIAACNLIIKYNNVGSERTMIQRRGRARQKNSRSILLALDSSIELSEFNNIRKEAMMMSCIQSLQETDDMALRKEIERKQLELQKIQERQEQQLQEKRERLKGRRYKLCCQSCGHMICESPFIRSVTDTLFIVCDPEVWKRSKLDVKTKPSKDNLTTKCARWLCGRCGTQEWGNIVKYSNCYLPHLTAGSFTLDRLDSQSELDREYSEGSRRTWNQIQDQFFNIDPVTKRNICQMYTALLKFMPLMIRDMDQMEYRANAKFLEKMAEKKKEHKNRIQVYLEE